MTVWRKAYNGLSHDSTCFFRQPVLAIGIQARAFRFCPIRTSILIAECGCVGLAFSFAVFVAVFSTDLFTRTALFITSSGITFLLWKITRNRTIEKGCTPCHRCVIGLALRKSHVSCVGGMFSLEILRNSLRHYQVFYKKRTIFYSIMLHAEWKSTEPFFRDYLASSAPSPSELLDPACARWMKRYGASGVFCWAVTDCKDRTGPRYKPLVRVYVEDWMKTVTGPSQDPKPILTWNWTYHLTEWLRDSKQIRLVREICMVS